MDNVLVLFETNSAFQKELSGILSGYRVIFNESDDTSSIDAETAENIAIIFGSPEPDFLKSCKRLRWLQIPFAGANLYVGKVKETTMLTSATGAYGHAVSEHMAALTFELLKKLHLYRDAQNVARWQSRGMVRSIRNAVILVVGLGDIGSSYARIMKALGCYIIGVRRTTHVKPDYVDELLLPQEMDEAIPRADVVALSVPETKETKGLFSRARLAKIKKGAVIINSGRGSVIDTEALCDALESGALGGAALDVIDPEPLPADHRLWKLENAVITPHVAGGDHLQETTEYIMRLSLENASRFMQGKPLKSLIDFKTGYRIPED